MASPSAPASEQHGADAPLTNRIPRARHGDAANPAGRSPSGSLPRGIADDVGAFLGHQPAASRLLKEVARHSDEGVDPFDRVDDLDDDRTIFGESQDLRSVDAAARPEAPQSPGSPSRPRDLITAPDGRTPRTAVCGQTCPPPAKTTSASHTSSPRSFPTHQMKNSHNHLFRRQTTAGVMNPGGTPG